MADVKSRYQITLEGLQKFDEVEKHLDRIERTEKQIGKSTGITALATAYTAGRQAVSDLFGPLQRITGEIIRQGQAILRTAADFETAEVQLETFTGSAFAAREEITNLSEFAARTPFQLAELVEADRQLLTFGGRLLASEENLARFGDASAAVNRPLQETTFWIGRMYDAIQSGQPFGEAALRLQEMGILTGDARREMERLKESGASADEQFAVFTRHLDTQFAGGMERLSQTLSGLLSTVQDEIELIKVQIGQGGVVDLAKIQLQEVIGLLGALREGGGAENLGQAIAAGLSSVADVLDRMLISILLFLDKSEPKIKGLQDAVGIGAAVAGIPTRNPVDELRDFLAGVLSGGRLAGPGAGGVLFPGGGSEPSADTLRKIDVILDAMEARAVQRAEMRFGDIGVVPFVGVSSVVTGRGRPQRTGGGEPDLGVGHADPRQVEIELMEIELEKIELQDRSIDLRERTIEQQEDLTRVNMEQAESVDLLIDVNRTLEEVTISAYHGMGVAASAFYENVKLKAAESATVQALTQIQLGKILKASFFEGVSAFLDAEGQKAAYKAAENAAWAIEALAHGNFAAAALFGSAAAKFIALSAGAGIASGFLSGRAQEAISGPSVAEQGLGGFGEPDGVSADRDRRSRIPVTAQVATPENLIINLSVIHQGATIYGRDGIEDLWRNELVPLARQSFLNGEIG